MTNGIVAVISGPAGTGKGTVVKKLCSEYENFNLSVSLTTRAPRPGEADGREYFFITKEEFKKRIEEGRVLEYTEYCGNMYGTPADYVMSLTNEGKDVILEIETDGASQIKKLLPEAITIFLVPESKEKIRERLVNRGTEPPEIIEKRLKKAESELLIAAGYDYIVVNPTGNIDSAVNDIVAIFKSEKCRVCRNRELLTSF